MVTAVPLLASFAIGIIFSIIGALKLELAKTLKIDNAKVGALISSLFFTITIVVLIAGPLLDIVGHKPFAVFGFIIGFIGVFMLVSAKSYRAAVISCVILGIGATLITTMGNVLLTVVLFNGKNPPAALNLGNIFYGLGAFFTPFAIGMFLKKWGYRKTGKILAVFVLIPIIFAILARNYPQVSTGFELVKALGLFKNGVIIFAALSLFAYIGLEVSMGGWISSFASGLGFTDRNANITLSLYWIGLMAGRLIASGFGIKPLITPEIGISVCIILAIVAIIAIGAMTFTKSKTIAVLGVIFTGLSFGPIYPTVLGVALSNPEVAQLQGSAFGLVFAIGLLGGSTIPAAIGIYSKGKTMQQSFRIALATAIVMLIMVIIMGLF